MSSSSVLPQHIQEVCVDFTHDTETKPSLKFSVKAVKWLR